MIFCSWVIVLSPFPVPEGRVAVPVRGENRARPRHPLRKPTTIVRLSSSYRTSALRREIRLRERCAVKGRPQYAVVRSTDAALLVRRCFGRRRTGQCSVEFLDSAALCLDADKQEDEDREKKPRRKIVEARNDRVVCCLWVDVIGGAGDHRETGRTNEFADVTRPINEAETARAQRRRPQL